MRESPFAVVIIIKTRSPVRMNNEERTFCFLQNVLSFNIMTTVSSGGGIYVLIFWGWNWVWIGARILTAATGHVGHIGFTIIMEHAKFHPLRKKRKNCYCHHIPMTILKRNLALQLIAIATCLFSGMIWNCPWPEECMVL